MSKLEGYQIHIYSDNAKIFGVIVTSKVNCKDFHN